MPGIYTEKEVVEIYAVCHNLKEIENKLVVKFKAAYPSGTAGGRIGK